MSAASPLPDRVERYGLVVRRWEVDEAPVLHELVAANTDHLSRYTAWVADEPQTLAWRHDLVERWTREWAAGGDVNAGIWLGGRVVGAIGLHRRVGPRGLSIGYWVDRDHLGRGVATAAARALTDLAFTVPDIERVQIGHDASNAASARVPAKLGFERRAERPATSVQALASTGVDVDWLMTREGWAAQRATGRSSGQGLTRG